LLLCQVGLRRRSRAALVGWAGLRDGGTSSRRLPVGYHPVDGRKLGDDGGELVTGLQPGHGAVGRCCRRDAPAQRARSVNDSGA
jgi:hypothetical protein